MNPISVANTISSSPPTRPLPRPGYAYPMPSAPPLDDVFTKGSFVLLIRTIALEIL